MNEHSEDEARLREALRDGRWSLRAWPDAMARVRRTARRQRLTAAGASAFVIAAIAVPVTLLTMVVSPVSRPGEVASGHGSAHAARYLLPTVGAAGFPALTYPAARKSAVVSTIGQCPNPAGLWAFGTGTTWVAGRLPGEFGMSFGGDLRRSDRAFWPVIARMWNSGSRGFSPTIASPRMWAGPLSSYDPSYGAPDPAWPISRACGNALVQESWLIVYGQRSAPALQSEYLFVNRRGHVLLYFVQ